MLPQLLSLHTHLQKLSVHDYPSAPVQRADARIDIIAVIADDRLLARVVVVSVVLLDVFQASLTFYRAWLLL